MSRRPVIVLLQPARDDREMYREFLRHHDLAVVCPTDATRALAVAPNANVIVTALALPGEIDGIEFIRNLRERTATADMPIIVLTARAWTTDRVNAVRAGCNLFLTKPCLPAALLDAINRVRSHAASCGTRTSSAGVAARGRRRKMR